MALQRDMSRLGIEVAEGAAIVEMLSRESGDGCTLAP